MLLKCVKKLKNNSYISIINMYKYDVQILCPIIKVSLITRTVKKSHIGLNYML